MDLLEYPRKDVRNYYQYFLVWLIHIIFDWLIKGISVAYLFVSNIRISSIEDEVLLTGLC